MDENKKNELNDEMLEGVAGGTSVGDEAPRWQEGDRIQFTSWSCLRCGRERPTGTIETLFKCGTLTSATVRMDCCGKIANVTLGSNTPKIQV